jgi:Ca2+-binding EF-hand superfamily protein
MLEETYKGLGYTVTDQDITDAMATFDADKSGAVSRAEYLDVVKKAYANINK